MKNALRLFLIVGILLITSNGYAAPGALLWSDESVRGQASVVAAQGRYTFVGGSTSGNFTVRAYSAAEGDLLWSHEYAHGVNGDINYDEATAIAVQCEKVFVGGRLGTYYREPNVWEYSGIVRAYRAADGMLLWEADFNGPKGGRVAAITVQWPKVFVAGWTTDDNVRRAFTVRAFSAATGNLLWEDVYHGMSDGDNDASGISVQGWMVYVAGQTTTSSGNSAFTVRAYAAHNGKLVWQNYSSGSGDLKKGGSADDIVANGLLVHAGGATRHASGQWAFTVRTYWALTGKLLWSDYYHPAGDVYNVALKLAVSGNHVYASGQTNGSADSAAFTVRAYGALTGKLLWSDDYVQDPGLNYSKGIASLSLYNQVCAVGLSRSEAAGAHEFTVRTYAGDNGNLLWEDLYDGGGGASPPIGAAQWANAVAAWANRYFAVGVTAREVDQKKLQYFTVRAYAAR